MFGGDVVQAAIDRGLELLEGIVMSSVEHVAFDELPQSFDQVEVRRIGWQELQFDVEHCRQIHDQRAVLVAGVVQHQGDRTLQAEGSDLPQQLTHRVR